MYKPTTGARVGRVVASGQRPHVDNVKSTLQETDLHQSYTKLEVTAIQL